MAGLVYASGVVFFGVNESGLVGEWHFDGNADDSSGNENDGTLLSSSVSLDNNITYTIDSKGGSHALNFPGTIVSLNQLNGDDDLPFGQSTNYQKIAQSFVAPSTGLVRSIGARRGTDGGDPTGTVYFDIANDDGGEPGTIRITKSYTDTLFNIFKTDAERFHNLYTVLTPGVTYWLVYRMSTTNDSNYRNIKYDSGGSYGTLKEFDGTNWNTISGTLRFNLRYNDDLVFDSNVVLPYNDFTVSWWMKRNDKVYENIFSKSRDATNGRISVATGGQIYFESYTNNVFSRTMTTNVDDLNWHHYTLVSLSDDFKLYVDGVNTYSFGSANTDAVDQRYRYIGVQNAQMPYTYGIALNALLDEVKMYNRALSTTEVSQLYEDTKLKVSSLQKGLVGHWALDGESLNNITNRTTDKTPYSNHGTVYGATLTTDQMGQSNRAMSFGGSSDYVNVPDSEELRLTSVGTISVWAKTDRSYPSDDGTTKYRGIVSKTSSGGVGGLSYFIDWTGTNATRNLRAYIYDDVGGNGFNVGNFDFGGEWVHFVFTWDGTQLNFYINDVPQTPVSQTKSALPIVTSLDIGRAFKSGYWEGIINEVRIYNHALSADEIDTLYHSYRSKASAGSLQKGLVLDMPLNSKYTKDEIVGSEIMTDRTPYSNDGQNYGANVGTDYTTFDGVDNYVEALPVPSDIGAFSVVLWINTTRQNDFVYYIHRGVSASIGGSIFCLGEYANYLMWAVNGRYEAGKSSTLIPESEFICLIGTYDGDKAKLFLNGDLIHTDTFGAITSEPSGNKMGIGGTAHPYANRFTDGSISSLKIYNRALSESEIKLLYDKGR